MNYITLCLMMMGMVEGKKVTIKAKRNKFLDHTKDGKIGKNGSDYNQLSRTRLAGHETCCRGTIQI